MSNGTCEFLYVGYPQCETTYAEELGRVFDVLQLVYAALAVTIAAICVWVTATLAQRKGLCPLDPQKRIIYLCVVMVVTLLVRAVDPVGFRTWLNQTVVLLCYDVASAAMYSIIISLICDWVNVVFKISGRRHMQSWACGLCYALIAASWLMFVTTSVLQSTQENIWLFRAIKLLSGSAILFVMSVSQFAFGFRIWLILRNNANKFFHQSRSGTESGESSAASTPETATPTTSEPPSPNSQSRSSVLINSQRRSMSRSAPRLTQVTRSNIKARAQIDRVLKLLIVAAAAEFFTVLFQINSGLSHLRTRYTRSNPGPAPTSPGALASEVLPDAIQMVAICIAFVYFRPRAEAAPDESDRSTVTPRAAEARKRNANLSLSSLQAMNSQLTEMQRVPPQASSDLEGDRTAVAPPV